MQQILFIFRFIWRELLAKEFTLIIIALLIAISLTSSMNLFATRLQQGIDQQTAALYGADLILQSNQPITQKIMQHPALSTTQVTFLNSMASSKKQFLLVTLKAVENNYPIRGNLIIKTKNIDNGHVSFAPRNGNAFVDPRVLFQLHVKVGDKIGIGNQEFTITGIIVNDPQQTTGSVFTFTPHVIINQKDVAKTGVLTQGSIATYLHLYAGPSGIISQLASTLKDRLNSSQSVYLAKEGRIDLQNVWQNSKRYLVLADILTFLLAGLTISLAVQELIRKHKVAAALMRCFGVQAKDLLIFYATTFVLLTGATYIVGFLFGYELHKILVHFFAKQYGALPDLHTYLPAFVQTITTSMLLFLGFLLPSLLLLLKVSPQALFQSQVLRFDKSIWLCIGIMLASLLAMLILRNADWYFVAILLTGVVLVIICNYYSAKYFISSLNKLSTFIKEKVGLYTLSFKQDSFYQSLQSIGFTITFFVTFLIILVRYDLIADLNAYIPKRSPNYFIININANEMQSLKSFLTKAQNQQPFMNLTQLYPVVRGRLVALNSRPIFSALTNEQAKSNALHRDLYLTWAAKLPEDNLVLAGHFKGARNSHEVSVEHQLAQSLGLKLGDELTFEILGQTVTATLTSFRQVSWGTFKPNFYFIFSPGVIDQFPYSYITSIYIPSTNIDFLSNLIAKFPDLTVLDIDNILKETKKRLDSLVNIINYVLVFVLASSLAVFLAVLQITRERRKFEIALLRALGATKYNLRKQLFFEFMLQGAWSGLLAIMFANLAVWYLSREIFAINYKLHFSLLLLVPLMTGMAQGVLSMQFIRSIIRTSPMVLLNEYNR